MIWDKLAKPFFVLAPMDDVTDTVFRQIVADCAPPDLYMTEFVNVDGLQSPGRSRLIKKLQFTQKERPIIAQIWGKEPKNFYKTAQELVEMGFDGVDLNFGCPVKAVVKNGACIALANNRPLAAEIIQATRAGVQSVKKSHFFSDRHKSVKNSKANPHIIGLSVKTRLGLNEVDLSWPEFLLKQKIDALIIHGRTAKQLSKVPADWELIGKVKELRDKIAPGTKIIGNGDVTSKANGQKLAAKYKLDGIMIGRGIFDDPFVFSKDSPWKSYTKEQKIELYKKHVQLFAKTWEDNERRVQTLNKFCKIYIQGFNGASQLREKLMGSQTTEELMKNLTAL